jgi:hypothetical protein
MNLKKRIAEIILGLVLCFFFILGKRIFSDKIGGRRRRRRRKSLSVIN